MNIQQLQDIAQSPDSNKSAAYQQFLTSLIASDIPPHQKIAGLTDFVGFMLQDQHGIVVSRQGISDLVAVSAEACKQKSIDTETLIAFWQDTLTKLQTRAVPYEEQVPSYTLPTFHIYPV